MKNRDNGRFRVLIADDHDLYRAGLHLLLNQEQAVSTVVEASSLHEAISQLSEKPYRIAVFDIDMPGMAGPGSFAAIRGLFPNLTIIAISAFDDHETVTAAIGAGCDYYIPKSLPLAAMIDRVRTIIEGLRLGDVWGYEERLDDHDGLTERQLDVLKSLMEGLSNKEIGRQLGIAPGTVKIHLAALFKYFAVRNRTELLKQCSTPQFAQCASLRR